MSTGESTSLNIPAEVDSVRPCIAFVAARALAAGFPAARVREIELVVEEVVPFRWVAMDEGYGAVGYLLDQIDRENKLFFAEIPRDKQAWPRRPKIVPPAAPGPRLIRSMGIVGSTRQLTGWSARLIPRVVSRPPSQTMMPRCSPRT